MGNLLIVNTLPSVGTESEKLASAAPMKLI